MTKTPTITLNDGRAIPRDQIWVTSKLWLQDYGFDAASRAIDRSLTKLRLD